MQGIVKDDNGAYVKSAIVRLLKISDTIGESDEEAVTYAETDEDGKFVISDLGPDERYIIEVHIEIPEPAAGNAEPAPAYETEPVYEPELDDEPEQYDEQETNNEPEIDDEPETDEEPEDWTDGGSEPKATGEIIDSLNFGSTAGETIKMNLSINSLYNIGFDPKDKSYLTRNNTW